MTADRVPTDQATRDRIIRELGATFAVEAGAGTGKTTLLTSRIVEAVRTGHARLGEIVAITFTDRAANELKVRLRDKLELLRAQTKGPEADRLSDALAALDTAHASTIHSFAAELLRERPVEAGVDPGFEIAESLAASLLFEDVWTRWLARQLDDEAGPLRAAFVAGVPGQELKRFARFLIANRDLAPAGEEIDITAAVSAFVGRFVPAAQELARRVQDGCPSPACSCAGRITAALRAARQLDGASPADALARIPSIPKLRLTKPHQACDGARRDACLRGLGELEDLIGDLRAPAGHIALHGLAGTLRGMVAEYESAKRRRALLDFDDLLLKARDLLRDNRPVRRYFQERFKMILVDECQDTDPLQIEIALFLAEDGARAASWRDVHIAPGKLLFVGDPKQSIYRFRRADIEIYEQAKQLVARSGEALAIRQNFRSAAPCVAWFNAVFAALIERPEDGAYQPDYVALDAWRGGEAPAVTVLGPPAGRTFDKIGEARAGEAAAVAAHIRAMVDRGDPVFDKPTDRTRPVTFGDVAVLFRRRISFQMYERALTAHDVPFRAVSGKSFFAKQEVSELRTVLKAIERPYDPLAVVAALRTSVLGISDDELAAAAEGGFHYAARAEPAGGAYLGQVFALLAEAHRGRNARSISGLVQWLLSETKALELFYLKPGGEQRAANLTKLIDAARAYEQTPGATFGGFVRWLDELTGAGDEGESPLAEEDGEFVTLLTVHKAKGLEFPVVILADISGGRAPHITEAVDRPQGTFDVQLGSNALNVKTLGFDDAKAREARRDAAEERRLLYVAATRARDRLIIPRFPAGDKPGGTLKYLANLMDDAASGVGDLQHEVRADPADLVLRRPRAFRVDLSAKPPQACAARRAARQTWRRERETLIAGASVGKRLATASQLERFGPEEQAPGGRERAVAQAVGTAVHAVLEQVDLSTGEGLAALAEAEAQRNDIPERRGEIEELARAALGSDAVTRAVAAGRFFREIPFAVRTGEGLLEGVIDLAYDDGGGLAIADYKTDDVPARQLAGRAEAYRLQVGAYALAVREVFGAPPRSASLLFLRLGREVPVEIDDALLDAVRDSL